MTLELQKNIKIIRKFNNILAESCGLTDEEFKNILDAAEKSIRLEAACREALGELEMINKAETIGVMEILEEALK